MNNHMLMKVMLAMVLAVVAGYLSGPDAAIFGVTFLEMYSLIGQLFLNALTLVVVPLVAASIITGTARMGAESSFGSLGLKTFGIYTLTTGMAIVVGWVVAMLVAPGVGHDLASYGQAFTSQMASIQQFADHVDATPFHKIELILLKLVPSNILAVASQGQMLGLIFFSLLFGYFIPKIDSEASGVLMRFWKGIFEVMMCMTHLVMKTLPIGVFGLMAKVVATTGFDAIRPIGYFFGTVVLALLVYTVVVLPLLLYLSGVNPLRHFKAVFPALFTAFSTSSSAATLPITIDCMEKRAGVSNRICSFTIPLATSLNLSGTGLYICVSIFFICQVYGLALGFPLQVFIVLMSLLTSIGIAGIPSASIVAIVMILQTIGLPADGIALILAVERLLDMCRTVVNVFGNTVCAVLIAKSEGEGNVLVRT